MIDWLSNWAGGIVIAVIIGTIIEMILPEGNCKKYIKVVIGIYVLFTIISPVISEFTGDNIKLSDTFDLDTYIEEAKETSKVQNMVQTDNESNIQNIYISGLKDDMKAKIEAKGYIVESIDIEIANDDTYSIKSISVQVYKNDVEDKDIDNDDNNSNTNKIEEISKVEKVEKVEKINIDTNNKNDSEDNNESSNSLNNNSANNSSNENNNLNNSEISDLKEYLSSVYEVNEDNITIT